MRKALQHLRDADPILAGIIEQVGPFRMKYTEPTFHGLARSIVYQQLSGYAAGTIFGRLLAAASDPLRPETVMELPISELRALGLSQQKAAYIRDLAERTARREVQFEKLPRLRDEYVIAQLTQVKGIGPWTVHMFLMFALRRRNVLPTGDLGIRSAIKRAYGLRELPAPAAIERIAQSWHPYCSVASWYLWRSLELEEPAKKFL
jgi:DNA-3-methyladenine glycosylase II